MRGKVAGLLDGGGQIGITPAYAGKRGRVTKGAVADRDHPRVCGEKLRTFKDENVLTGSPPRMRGKALDASIEEHGLGITPAYAGKRPP